MALTLFEVFEASSDDGGVGDFADDAEFPSAFWTGLEVESEHSVESSQPGQRRGGRFARGLSLLRAGAVMAGRRR